MVGANFDHFIEILKQKKVLSINEVLTLTEKAKEFLSLEDNLISLQTPIVICGDLHGQFADLLALFHLIGDAPKIKYLFLGDYVDRGSCSVETISILTCLKVCYPERVFLIRGNHESRSITQVYGFRNECLKKYNGDSRVWNAFTDLFDFLPIGAVIDQQILALHGGLSPSVQDLDEIRVIDRFAEIPPDGPFADIVWSDPDTKNNGFHISPRGAGYMFGGDIVEKFLHQNKIGHISRAHQLCMEGFQVLFDDTFSTVWSAPNYCHRFGNLASVMMIDEQLQRSYKTFTGANSTLDKKIVVESSKSDVVDSGYFV